MLHPVPRSRAGTIKMTWSNFSAPMLGHQASELISGHDPSPQAEAGALARDGSCAKRAAPPCQPSAEIYAASARRP